MDIKLGKVPAPVPPELRMPPDVRPPVPGAVRLTPLEMNMLHFGSDRHSPLRAGSTINAKDSGRV